MLNILYVGTLPPHPGGGALSCAELLVGLARLGHTVQALAPIRSDAAPHSDWFATRYREVDVTRYPIPHFHVDPSVLPSDDYRKAEREQIRKALPALIARSRPDVIFIGRGVFVLDVPDIARVYSLPCVLRTAGATTIGILNHTFPDPLAQQLIAQYRLLDLIISPAAHLARSLRQFGFINVQTVPAAVDLYRFCPRPKSGTLLRRLGIGIDDVVIVHASNLKTLKRPMDLVSSAERALRLNPKLVYVMVADGPLRGALEDACRRNGLDTRFRFVGWVDHARMPDYVNLADMVVMPSEDEALARVYLETQACARLLLASDIPGAREVLVDGESGLLFRKGDVEDLTAKTLLAARDPQLRARIGQQARRQVQTRSLAGAVAAYATALRHTVEQHRGSLPRARGY